ncbi:MAG: hypothetical protein JSV63_01845 [Candidatus Aenigmatarchaeota archaeon]|nr:MAG: hypothetical protein JSV63_01845 [Candidatus Aenigmarchaeota archaeon]
MILVLLVITLIISFIGTLAAISSFTYRDIPVVEKDLSQTSGKVSVYVLPPPPPPAETTGKVSVYVLPSEEGG